MPPKASILIIEDDPDYQETLRTILEPESYTLTFASSGTEGLEKVAAVQPDLIILDVMMEKVISGFEVAHRIKSKDPNSPYAAYRHIPILVLTGIHQTTFFRFGPDEEYLPVEAFVEKPVRREELLRQVQALLTSS